MAREHRKGDGNSAQGVANHSFQSFERSKAICRSSLYPDIEHVHLFSDNVHAVRRACAASITDVMDALKIDDFKDELLPSLISLYNSSGNYQIQSIPNIRFITCKVIGKTFKQFTPDFQKEYVANHTIVVTRFFLN